LVLGVIDQANAELSCRETMFEGEDLGPKRGLSLIADVIWEGDVRKDLVPPY
jgi:hypothetical protein